VTTTDAHSVPRVLVVEDDPMIGELLEDILGTDYAVVRVAGAAAALSELEKQRTDVLLLDYRLPDGSGQEVADSADRAGIPLVWITGDPSAVQVLTDDTHAVLPKPFGLLGVKAALTKVLKPH
jgi:DNA-binding response OmpR family regulator